MKSWEIVLQFKITEKKMMGEPSTVETLTCNGVVI